LATPAGGSLGAPCKPPDQEEEADADRDQVDDYAKIHFLELPPNGSRLSCGALKKK